MNRQRIGEQGWREVMARFRTSGQTASEFCKREGVSKTSFYAWRSRLGLSALSAPGPDKSIESGVAPGFVDLGLLGNKSTANTGALELCLELGAGVVLHLVRH